MPIRDYDPTQGQAFQGDIAIIPIPASITIATTDEIKPIDGRLIIQEGEVSGHHHAIDLLERPPLAEQPVRRIKTSRVAEKLMADAIAGKIAIPMARLFHDPRAVDALRSAGILSRVDLAIGCLVVEHGPMVISHEEHDGIRLPPGQYYLGRQIESVGAEERIVVD